MSSGVVLYGVVIQDALARGDLNEMKRVAASARTHLDHYGDVAQGLAHLQTAIRGKEGVATVPLYATALQEAMARGDKDEIKELTAAAEKQVAQAGELKKALDNLKDHIAKLEG